MVGCTRRVRTLTYSPLVLYLLNCKYRLSRRQYIDSRTCPCKMGRTSAPIYGGMIAWGDCSLMIFAPIRSGRSAASKVDGPYRDDMRTHVGLRLDLGNSAISSNHISCLMCSQVAPAGLSSTVELPCSLSGRHLHSSGQVQLSTCKTLTQHFLFFLIVLAGINECIDKRLDPEHAISGQPSSNFR